MNNSEVMECHSQCVKKRTKAVTLPQIAATPATHPTAIPIITGVESPPKNTRKGKMKA